MDYHVAYWILKSDPINWKEGAFCSNCKKGALLDKIFDSTILPCFSKYCPHCGYRTFRTRGSMSREIARRLSIENGGDKNV